MEVEDSEHIHYKHIINSLHSSTLFTYQVSIAFTFIKIRQQGICSVLVVVLDSN